MDLKVNWHYNQHTEAIRVLHTAAQLASGFYRINGFVVVPHIPSRTSSGFKIVTLPELDYLKIPGFWRKVTSFSESNFRNMEHPLSADIERLMLEGGIRPLDYSERKEQWDGSQMAFFQSFSRLMPKIDLDIDQIDIYPTEHGTSGSFTRLSNGKRKLKLFYRIDMEPWYIAKLIALAATRGKVYELYGNNWQNSQVVVDWMLNETELAEILQVDSKKYLAWVQKTPSSAQVKQGMAFREQLGLKKEPRIFKCDEAGGIYYQENKLRGLTPKQRSLLKCLIRSSNRTVPYNVLWDSLNKDRNEDYSLQSVNKSVERLRKSLELNGAASSMICTDRGVGYLLMN